MKQNGVRLVQRKFAQGVPIPASSSGIAPLPPERKAELLPKNVYHSNMSAKGLLDIVAMQNIHKHKQPLVVLERLRADEIPSPLPKAPPRMRKRKVKPKKKNNMCLRSGKRKSPDAVKGPAKKRKKLLSSESTDDLPLKFYKVITTNQPAQAKPQALKGKKNLPTPKKKERQTTSKRQPPAATRAESIISEKSEDNGKFKEPSSPARFRYGVIKKKPKTVRELRKNASLITRWASLRSARAPSVEQGRSPARSLDVKSAAAPSEPRMARPLRAVVRSGKKLPREEEEVKNYRARKGPKTVSKDDQPQSQPGPSGARADTPLTDDDDYKLPLPRSFMARLEVENDFSDDRAALVSSPTSSIDVVNLGGRHLNFNFDSNSQRSSREQPDWCIAVSDENVKPELTSMDSDSREPPPIPDVYEFDAELEASRPPSALRRRAQAAPEPGPSSAPEPGPSSAPEPGPSSAPDPGPSAGPAPAPTPTSPDIKYVDILPTSSLCIRITPKQRPESGSAEECVSVGLVPKEEISVKKKKNLIENLSNSPALLNKFFNCLTADMQTELDNLITAEGLNEPQPSTSSATPTYLDHSAGTVCDAPVFYPTAEEFSDPIKYIEKIAPRAEKHGICKIVPPEGFKPPCHMNEVLRFAVVYQYISKMYNRWGPVSRELTAIKSHLRTQSVFFSRSPLLDGREVNLSKLFRTVEKYGGVSAVIDRKRWGRVAEEMKLGKLQHAERKLDQIYIRYLLPYATLSDQERQNILAAVEKAWTKKYQKMLNRASNPLERQKRMLGNEVDSDSEDEAEDSDTASALDQAEDCIVHGRPMKMATFKKIATAIMDAHFTPSQQPPSAADVEKTYWRDVLFVTEHIVANTASIDTGEEGYGFPKDPDTEYGSHPWNLKALARNPNNVLRYLGSLLGVTVPTLHLNMLFSTSCWHRDPHGLPWIEFMHSGAEKIWYGIPRGQSSHFRRAVETLCPAYCQNKSIWLASEITMVPPDVLSGHGVKLCRLQQRPGEYVVVFPEAHSCSITTGLGISESVYFASNEWLTGVYKLFQDLRNSCEPTMFSLEQLLVNGSADSAAPPQVCVVLRTLLHLELEHRRELDELGLHVKERAQPSVPLNTSYSRAWNTKDQDECEYCRSTLFLSKVTGLTGRNSAVCPEHALCLLNAEKYKDVDVATLEFVSSFSTASMEEMLERLEARIAADAELDRKPTPAVIDLTGPADSTEPPAEQAEVRLLSGGAEMRLVG